MKRYMQAFWKDEQGQDLVEYALLAALLALAAVVILPQLATSVNAVFEKVKTTLDGANPA